MKKYSVEVTVRSAGVTVGEYRQRFDTTGECVRFVERVADKHDLPDWDYFREPHGMLICMADGSEVSPFYGTAHIHRTAIVVLD